MADLKIHRLSDFCRALGRLREELHRALPDARAAAKLFQRRLFMLDSDGAGTLEDVQRIQGSRRSACPLSRATPSGSGPFALAIRSPCRISTYFPIVSPKAMPANVSLSQ